MTRYQTRPRIVEAVQNQGEFSHDQISGWLLDLGQDPTIVGGSIYIRNRDLYVYPTDWLIRNPDGTFSVETDEAFREKHEEVKE